MSKMRNILIAFVSAAALSMSFGAKAETYVYTYDTTYTDGTFTVFTDSQNQVTTYTYSSAQSAEVAAQMQLYELNNTPKSRGVYTLNGGVITVSPVPEPETYAMMAIGLAMIGWTARKQMAGRMSFAEPLPA